ncbi:MAG: NUDIX domain-containing protein [Acidimicrobiia bacterium]|nr:NUDIX domain-containing protein [Acidimicrobiia bacterium]MYE73147.1 NUDIX domain-containing protein [Acidimicrobiia bacterium]MYJ61801.1 NUDIX domain-containing protein [Acidimicrobiia bacterium]
MSESPSDGKRQRFADWAGEDEEAPELVAAATVVLLRDAPGGLETLMMRRSSKLSFVGGMWVFPGGRVDDDDYPAGQPDNIFAASRVAAVREAAEEADLVIAVDDLVPYSHWVPPTTINKRFATWFFLAPAPAGTVTVDGGEIKEHAWWRPAETMARHAAGEIEMVPPTFITLMELGEHQSVDDALVAARDRSDDIPHYETHIALDGKVPVSLWHGDAGYDTHDASAPGPRHRLTLKEGGWRFERT